MEYFKSEMKFDVPEPFKLLEDQFGSSALNNFMFMGVAMVDGKDIYLYKNIMTRTYLNIDTDGNFYKYHAVDGYTEIDKETAWISANR